MNVTTRQTHIPWDKKLAWKLRPVDWMNSWRYAERQGSSVHTLELPVHRLQRSQP
jgi:hypothetical protein